MFSRLNNLKIVFCQISLVLIFIIIIFILGKSYLSANIIFTYFPFIITVIIFLNLTQYKLRIFEDYKERTNLFKVIISWVITLCFTVLVLFVFKISDQFSRIIIGSTFLIMPILNMVLIEILKKFPVFLENSFKVKVLLISSGKEKEKLEEYFSKQKDLEIINMDPKKYMFAKNIIKEKSIQKVIIAIEEKDLLIFPSICRELEFVFSDVYFVQFGFLRYKISPLSSLSLENYNKIQFFPLNKASINSSPTGPFIKRSLDILLSLIGIIICLPIFVVISILIRIESEGPILFKQKRIGLHGKDFTIYKFRSMFLHDSESTIQAAEDDERITLIGSFIRRTSIDELPQLFNVLIGKMSIVGPRPHAHDHDQVFSSTIHEYIARHNVKPGITGLAQIRGFRGETPSTKIMRDRIEADIEYITNWSILLDIWIIVYTPIALVKFKAF